MSESGSSSIERVGVRSSSQNTKCFDWFMSRAFPTPREAIAREKQLKNWHRDWKIELIEKENLDWSDLSGLI